MGIYVYTYLRTHIHAFAWHASMRIHELFDMGTSAYVHVYICRPACVRIHDHVRKQERHGA